LILLLELKVKNLGIIEDIEWELDSGFNVITGETGAGKSLIIDAVELLLNGISSSEMIRTGYSEATVEGVFALPPDIRYTKLKEFLSSQKLDSDEETLIIRCEIRRGKPMICRINSSPVTKSLLRQTGQLLIDIHGQSDHLSLLNKKNHLELLDEFAHTAENRKLFFTLAAKFKDLNNQIEVLKSKEQDINKQSDFLKYQIEEITNAGLKESEDEELEQEKQILAQSERLKEYSNQIYTVLYEGDGSSLSGSGFKILNQAADLLRKLIDIDPALQKQLEEIEKSVYTIEETSRDVRNYCDDLSYDPHRLEEIETRLETIRTLKRKYGRTIPDIFEYLKNIVNELDTLSSSTEKRDTLEKELINIQEKLQQAAAVLSTERKQAATELEDAVNRELRDLQMEQMIFSVNITHKSSDEGISVEGTKYAYDFNGIDNVEFMVSTNPGEPVKPLSLVASTGEMSRFTLALKGALSESDCIPVLIFDEIDIGVGGRNGSILGRKMWSLSRNHQVICVTHLPQIAVYADAHYCVRKINRGSRTVSTLEVLSGMFRIHELSAMLTGSDFSETALQNIQEIKKKAEEWITANKQE
jgi:DNA repair protein RecN (Recombination protein N)